MARRYEPLLKIGVGGTATVWVGASAGALGFRQLVAIKRPHEHLAGDPKFVEELMREAKLAGRLRHANVVDVRDVEADESGVDLVMDWVEGASLSDLIRAWSKEPPQAPAAVAIRVVLDACAGLRALHELADEHGRPLGCVHRDVSPANVLVGVDGVARITDFGLARPLAVVERTTSEGSLRGKLGYMAPEYILGRPIDSRVDVFALGVVLWESLARKRLFRGENDAETLDKVRSATPPALALGVPSLDTLIARALAKDPSARIPTVAELATDLERIARTNDLIATHNEVAASFGPTLRATIESRRREVEQALTKIEAPFIDPALYSRTGPPPPLGPSSPRTGPPPPMAASGSGAQGSAPPNAAGGALGAPGSAPPNAAVVGSAPPNAGSGSAGHTAAFAAPTSAPPRAGSASVPSHAPPVFSNAPGARTSGVPTPAPALAAPTSSRLGAALVIGAAIVAGSVIVAVVARQPSAPSADQSATSTAPPIAAPPTSPEPAATAAEPGVAVGALPNVPTAHPAHSTRKAAEPTSQPALASAAASAAPPSTSEGKSPRPNPYASAP
jgi:serine/threonine-protein kinase